MDQLQAALKIVLADSFVMYFKLHSYHWNVEGSNFGEMHDFFGDLYEDIYGTVDTWAEELRALNQYAPISIMELYNYKNIQEDAVKPVSVNDMLSNVVSANNIMIANLNTLFKLASDNNEQGLADVAAGRLDIHKKHGWMLRSYLKAGA
jgi:starvation-inducible DNA-binding protein